MGEIQNKSRTGFEGFYNTFLSDKAYYEADMSKSYQENLADLRKKVFVKNTCNFLYNRAEETFGLGYAEKLVKRILNGDISITQIERYPFKEFPVLETEIFSLDYYNQHAFLPPRSSFQNYVQFFGEIENLIINELKMGKAVNVMDFSMSLCLYMQHCINFTKFGLADIGDVRSRIFIFNQLLYRFLHIFSVPAHNCDQPVTISILDKLAYRNLTRNRKFSDSVNDISRTLGKDVGMDYDTYLETVQSLLLSFFMIGNQRNSYRTPNLRIYLACTDTRTKEFYSAIPRLTGCTEFAVKEAFKKFTIDETLNVRSPEFQEALNKCRSLASTRVSQDLLSQEEATNVLENLVQTKIIKNNKIEAVDKDLENLIYADKYCPTHMELVYYRPYKGLNFVPPLSETVIDYKHLAEGCKGLRDFKERLADAYIDAQTINQLRRKIISNRSSARSDGFIIKDRLNVKLVNVDDDLFYDAFEVVGKQNKKLTETYGDRFTFEITKVIDICDRVSKYYQM